MKKRQLFIGTSGWHYDDWKGLFYPADVTGYNELKFHAQHFNSVENNSSFYRIAGESTYKTWVRMTPDNYRFSLKLNKVITHVHRLELNDEVIERICYILDTTQVIGEKFGAIVIQLPPSFRYNIPHVEKFLDFFTTEIKKRAYQPDVAIELRNKYWCTEEAYALFRKYNVALVMGQSSRYPLMKQVTADAVYIRMHGPGKLFASPYSSKELEDLAGYITKLPKTVRRVYVYFNNDFHGYALENAKELMEILGVQT